MKKLTNEKESEASFVSLSLIFIITEIETVIFIKYTD